MIGGFHQPSQIIGCIRVIEKFYFQFYRELHVAPLREADDIQFIILNINQIMNKYLIRYL